jgi:tRNA A37 threonylcarbamoyladenosine biosynthesis protein TsaE
MTPAGGASITWTSTASPTPRNWNTWAARPLLTEPALWLIEWPDRGTGILPAADLVIVLQYLPDGRRLTLRPGSAEGPGLSAAVAAACPGGNPEP